jgi:hypothetical protein
MDVDNINRNVLLEGEYITPDLPQSMLFLKCLELPGSMESMVD